jgi:predicted nucleic acid-binding protein
MKVDKIVVGTDVLLEHTVCSTPPSLLRIAVNRYLCYTTVFNATELLAGARSAVERERMTAAMAALKVLGLHARCAPRCAALATSYPRTNVWDLLTAGLCLESRLPLLTSRERVFRRIRGLVVVPANSLRRT